jgi:hypothetical protein
MSDEGVQFVARGLLLVALILVTAAFRTMVGPSRRRGRVMLAGTLGGLAFGVLLSSLLSGWFTNDISSLSATAGLVLGWTVAWLFARRLPRYAN